MPRNNEEYEEQKCVVQYLEMKHIKFTSIPNSTFTSIGARVRNKMSGLRKGLPDMLMIINKRLVFIEMKKKKGGVVSPEQLEWMSRLNECESVYCYVCEGFESAKEKIDFHLKLLKI